MCSLTLPYLQQTLGLMDLVQWALSDAQKSADGHPDLKPSWS
jgi:hypothetical protein